MLNARDLQTYTAAQVASLADVDVYSVRDEGARRQAAAEKKLARALKQVATAKRELAEAGHEVVVLSRNPTPDEVYWDGRTIGPWARELEGATAVVNLAGRSVNCAAGEKARIRISRVTTSPAMPDAARIMATMMN